MFELSSTEARHVHGGAEVSLLTVTMSVMAPFVFFIFAKEPFYKSIGVMALCTELVGLYALNVKE